MRHLAALLSGLLLFASDQPLVLWWLQGLALVPLFWALGPGAEPERAWKSGLAAGLGYGVPLLLVAGTSLPILVALLAGLVQWFLLSIVIVRVLPRGAWRGPLAAAAAVTLLELFTWRAVPMFGTAQAFVRPLSAAPWLVGFVAYTGVAGLVFAVTLWNAWLARVLVARERKPALLGLLALGLLLALPNWLRWTRPLGEPIQAAAMGWNSRAELEPAGVLGAIRRFAPEAQAGQAVLYVSPELGLNIPREGSEAAVAELGTVASQHGLTTVHGVWHAPSGENRALCFGTEGQLLASYSKTHLIPLMENYNAGSGALLSAPLKGPGIELGAMICQDDNFTDLARAYGRRGAKLLAVPTADWPEIKGFHLENAVFRSIENGYAVVRAASGGVSALISPRGELLATKDHVKAGPGLLLGSLPSGDGRVTVYARVGDWPMLILGLALFFFPTGRRGRGGRAGAPQAAEAELSGVP
jgi:apolipoprotein N-acyltransferase